MTKSNTIPQLNGATTSIDQNGSVESLRVSLKGRADAKRSLGERLADSLTAISGSMAFLLVNVIWFVVWIVVNLGFIPGVPIFDPFPFGLLTMIVSLEAIALAIVVLISQNRAARLAELREETTLLVDEIAERELTKVLALTVRILELQGEDFSHDHDLHAMLENTDTEAIIQTLEAEIDGALDENQISNSSVEADAS